MGTMRSDVALDFDSVISAFYRAGACLQTWDQALVPFQQALSAWFILLLGIDPRTRHLTMIHSAGGHPAEGTLDYVRRFHRIDPRAEWIFGFPVNEWHGCTERFDEAFIARSPFYQDFLLPYGRPICQRREAGRVRPGTRAGRRKSCPRFGAIGRAGT